MPTRRGWGVVATVACSIAVARLLGIANLWVVGLTALAALVMAASQAGWRHGLRSARPPALATVAHDEPIRVQLGVHNSGRRTLRHTRVEDRTPTALARLAEVRLPVLRPGQTVRLGYTAVATRRGHHVFGPAQVEVGDPLGLFTRTVVLPGTSSAVVLPRIIGLAPAVQVVSGRVPGDEGAGVARPVGDDVGGLREYVRGDDLRRIHWAATAHRGQLMVRQPESRQHRRLLVWFDPSPGEHRTATTEFETRVSVAASIGAHHHDRAIDTSVVIDGSPRRGPGDWDLDVQRLALVEPTPGTRQVVTAMLGTGAHGSGTIVVVTPAGPHLNATLSRIGRQFERRLVVATATSRTTAQDRTMVGALQRIGWRGALVRSLDELPAAWQALGQPVGVAR